MNRRDNVTKHHTGIQNSLQAIDAYLDRGLPATKANLGFAFYIKWFRTAPGVDCSQKPVGCKTALMEDPTTGADLGQAGAFSWHDAVPSEISASFVRALEKGSYDAIEGGHYFWDAEERIWWSWDTPEAISRKFSAVVEKRGVGGVFAWGLGEDADGWQHLRAASTGVRNLMGGRWSGWGMGEKSEL